MVQFPLSTEIKNNYCKAPQNVCFAFEMFSSNDFAKAVIQLKEKLGCYPDKPSDGVQLGVLCNSLRALPDTSKKNLFVSCRPFPNTIQYAPGPLHQGPEEDGRLQAAVGGDEKRGGGVAGPNPRAVLLSPRRIVIFHWSLSLPYNRISLYLLYLLNEYFTRIESTY